MPFCSLLSSGICDVSGWWGCALLLVADGCACDDVGVRSCDLVGMEVISQDRCLHHHVWVQVVTSEYSLWVGVLRLWNSKKGWRWSAVVSWSHWGSPVCGIVSLCLWEDWFATSHALKLIHPHSLKIQLLYLVLASPSWILKILHKLLGKRSKSVLSWTWVLRSATLWNWRTHYSCGSQKQSPALPPRAVSSFLATHWPQ